MAHTPDASREKFIPLPPPAKPEFDFYVTLKRRLEQKNCVVLCGGYESSHANPKLHPYEPIPYRHTGPSP